METRTPSHVLLADDDDDDRLLFTDVLSEFSKESRLTFAQNGEQLMTLLRSGTIPEVLFLDLNMPLKNGIECLDEIRKDEKLKELPVVIFSTSSHPGTITRMYEIGAHLYIRKPNDFNNLRRVIRQVLKIDWLHPVRPPREEFVLGM
ncbi:MAG TPA: response regulator [Cyclobacteriaceae bacterium]|nr:response regulator [Cyclobacteriaceae bacterium]